MNKQQKFEINYTCFETWDDVPENYQQLMKEARLAKDGSYAPYSNFNVGAALLLNNGKIIHGSNQENASYPIGFCAERTALSAAASLASHEKIKAIAITAKSAHNPVLTPAAPCGICRQTIFAHFANLLSTVLIYEENLCCHILDMLSDILLLT